QSSVVDKPGFENVEHPLNRLKLLDLSHIPGRVIRLVAREVNKRKLAINVGVRNIRQHNAVGNDHKPTVRIERNNPFNLFPSIFVKLFAKLNRVVLDPTLNYKRSGTLVLMKAAHHGGDNGLICVVVVKLLVGQIRVTWIRSHHPPLMGPAPNDLRQRKNPSVHDVTCIVYSAALRIEDNLVPRDVIHSYLAAVLRVGHHVPGDFKESFAPHKARANYSLQLHTNVELVPQVVPDDPL